MNKTHLMSGLLVCALLFACSPKHETEKPQGVLTDTQKQTLDKAKKTQEVLDKANEEQKKTIDDAIGEK